MILKKIISALTSAAISLTAFTGLNLPAVKTISADAAGTVMNFDFGNSSAENGYIQASADMGYSKERGFGFAEPQNMANVSASGTGVLSDAVQFKSTDEKNTFNVDLPVGLYQITVYLGNTMRTSVKAENMLQIINMTGNNACHTFQMPVTDGQLNIMAVEGKAGYPFTMSALEIEKISDDPTMKPTIWLCGDSTVCNYYPLDTSTQGGWGQMLYKFVDTNKYEIRNMAASGQYAKGFVDAGQFKPIEYYGKKGDIYIISIGINDTNYSDANEYYQTVTSMVKAAKAKGMEVILIKQQGRNGDASRKPLLTSRWFAGELDKIGQEQNVQVIDLFNPWQDYCISIGTEAATALYMDGDTLHPNRQGAIKLAELAASQMSFSSLAPAEGAVMDENAVYMFKNANSGLYMEVADAKAEAGTNVQQWGAAVPSAHNTWKLKSAGDGYYMISSMLGENPQYFLDLDYGKTENGTNIGIYTDTDSDAQLFKFIDTGNGTYNIVTKVTNDKSAVEVINASADSGANIQEWELNGHDCQKWYAEIVEYPPATEPPTAAPTAETAKVLPGDADCNGYVNIADAVSIVSLIADSKRYPLSALGAYNGDVNNHGDGINSADAIMIQQHLLGSIQIPAFEDSFEPEPTEPETISPTEPVNLIYACDAGFTSGVTETVNSGFTGESYVNLDNITGSSITWELNAKNDGNYLVTFRVANGSTDDRKMKIEVNGSSDYWIQPFLPTGAWTEWTERAIVLPFKAGINIVKLTSETAGGGPNFDYVRWEQTEEPIAEIYVPEEPTTVPEADNPVVYIAGDSTVQSYRASYAPQQGWGYYLGDYFTDSVSVANHAIAGRSSKSFYDNGRLDTILNNIKEGDYLLVQFGINDSAASNPERYAPVCGNAANPAEGSFEYYIEKYITGALDKGAVPIMVTTVLGLKAYSNGKFVGSYGNYCQAMKDMAAKYNIPYIDLNSLMVDHYNSIGYDAAYNYHLISTELSTTDMTHFTETGAYAVAGLVANAIKQLGIPLSQYVK